MNILLVGSGGRESAFAWKLSQSKQLGTLYIAPGNPGTKAFGINVPIGVTDFDAMAAFCLQNTISMVVVGPEAPLVAGIYDYFTSKPDLAHISVIGPSKAGAQLEGSKDFSKAFMNRHKIPTAAYATFTKDTLEAGYAFLETCKPPYVLKADGLAAGKGVIITTELAEAKQTLHNMLIEAAFGAASSKVVIEEYLDGIELSVFVLTDGKNYVLLPEAKDYKRIGVGDTGLNTGGMGAVSPVPFANADFMQKVVSRIVQPTIEGIAKEQINYKGFIFIGLMNVNSNPYVIEYNCRMGDPETEVVLPRITSDLVEILRHVQSQTLSKISVETDTQTATTIVCVAGGYPDAYPKGDPITNVEMVQNAMVFHAGTAEIAGSLVTQGGRVLALTALGSTLEEALAHSVKAAETVSYKGKYYRSDIGADLLRLQRAS